MRTINAKTARGRALLDTANNYAGYTLRDVYGTWSAEKEAAMDKCRRMYLDEDGRGFHICSANGWAFSVSWKTDAGTRLITRDNDYLITD